MESPANRVLLLEDNPDHVRLIRNMLSRVGGGEFQVQSAQRLSHALELLDRDRFDIILLDLSLPDAQGLDAFAHVMAHRPDVPVVVLTGTDDPELATTAVQEGAQDYLVKDRLDGNLLVKTLRYAVERQRLLKARNEYLKVMAHDFRAPLMTMDMGLDFLKRHQAIKDDPHASDLIATVQSQARKLVQLSRDFLDVEGMQEGGLTLHPEPLDVAKLLAEVQQDHAILSEGRGVAILIRSARTPLPGVQGDPKRLRQALDNLVSNALWHTPRGGHIELSWLRHGGEVVISVKDTGRGMDSETLHRARLALQGLRVRPKEEPPKEGSGLGLGLTICGEIVRRHGGRIGVRSRPGEGACFRFTLPLSDRALLHVLAVDDDPAVLNFLKDFLEHIPGYRFDVRLARDVDTALEQLGEAPADLVLVDQRMPVSSGLDLIPRIKERRPGAFVVLMTGYPASCTEEDAHGAGADAYLTKPFEVDRLEAVIEESARRHGPERVG